MARDPTTVGIVVAIPVSLAFLLCHLRGHQKPDLGPLTGVFASVVAAVVGVDLGIQAVTLQGACITACRDQRLVMILGAIGFEWIAVTVILSSFIRVWAGGAAPPDKPR